MCTSRKGYGCLCATFRACGVDGGAVVVVVLVVLSFLIVVVVLVLVLVLSVVALARLCGRVESADGTRTVFVHGGYIY